jgi:hypothetical protein
VADPPRPTAQRAEDTLAHLKAVEVDVWVATASVSPEGVAQPYMVPLSLGWIDDRIVIAIETRSRTAKNLVATGRARLGIGPTRDVSMIDVEVEQVVEAADIDADLAERYADQTRWEPRKVSVPMVYFVLRPTRVQAWREANELEDRTIMRDGHWLA